MSDVRWHLGPSPSVSAEVRREKPHVAGTYWKVEWFLSQVKYFRGWKDCPVQSETRQCSAHAGLRYEIIATHTTQPIFKLDGASHLAASAILEYGQEHWGTLGEAMGIPGKGRRTADQTCRTNIPFERLFLSQTPNQYIYAHTNITI